MTALRALAARLAPAAPLALAALLAGACAKKPVPTAPVAAGVAPAIVATEPRARSLAAYDTDIWAQFAHPLDPASVNAKTVYLKLDNVRIPVTVTYSALIRRVTLIPQAALALERTFTVEFSTQVHAADGTPPPRTLYFQFTTNSLRRTTFLYPDEDGSEGPFASLGWGGNGPPVDSLYYDVYAGTDSAAVGNRTTPVLQHLPFVQYLPPARWPSGAVVYWSVTAENERTRERVDAPLRRFRTLSAATPVDSVRIALADYGAVDTRRVQYCGSATMPVGPGSVSGVHWSYAGLPPGARLAAARMVVFHDPRYAGQIGLLQPQAALPQNEWLACSFTYPGPPLPQTNGQLANATPGGETNSMLFVADALAAYFEAQARGRPFLYGMLLRAGNPFVVETARAPAGVTPYAVLTYYTPGP